MASEIVLIPMWRMSDALAQFDLELNFYIEADHIAVVPLAGADAEQRPVQRQLAFHRGAVAGGGPAERDRHFFLHAFEGQHAACDKTTGIGATDVGGVKLRLRKARDVEP